MVKNQIENNNYMIKKKKLKNYICPLKNEIGKILHSINL